MVAAAAAFAHLEGALVATVLGDLDPEGWNGLRQSLLDEVQHRGVRALVVDLSAVRVMDPDDFEHLRRTLKMAAVLGAPAVLTGVSAPLAAALASLGANLEGVVGEATVERALATARRASS